MLICALQVTSVYSGAHPTCCMYIKSADAEITYLDGQTDSVTIICSLCVEWDRRIAVCRQLTSHNTARRNITTKLHGLVETSVHVAETSPFENLRKENTGSESLRRADW